MDDVADVEVALNTVGVDHDEATGVIDVDSSRHECVGTAWQLHANVAPERDQGVAVLPGDVAGQRVEFLEDRQQHASGRDPTTGGVRADGGGPVGRPSDVETHPDDHGVTARHALGEDPGELALAEQHVIGPLEPDRRRDIGIDQAPHGCHGGEPEPLRHLGGHRRDRSDHHRHQQIRSRRRLPATIEPTATRGLMVGSQHRPVAHLAGQHLLDQVGVRAPGLGDMAHIPARRPRRRRPDVSVGGHGPYIGTRAQEDPDRQPRRNRCSSHPRRPGDGHSHGGGVLRTRP